MNIYLKQTILVKEFLKHCEFIDNFYEVIWILTIEDIPFINISE